MPKRPYLIPSQQLNVALPRPLYEQLAAHLFSPLEGRVPYKANSDFMVGLLRDFFSQRQLDLAPWVGSTPGQLLLTGSEAAVESLRTILPKEHPHG